MWRRWRVFLFFFQDVFGRSRFSPSPAQEMISRQMNSVFKELLSRQPTMPQSPLTAAAAVHSSSAAAATTTASSVPQAAPAAKKVGFGLRGRALFRPVD